jgi:hypothetical protein
MEQYPLEMGLMNVVLILWRKYFQSRLSRFIVFFMVANFRVNTGNAVKKFAQLHGIFVGKGGAVFTTLHFHSKSQIAPIS